MHAEMCIYMCEYSCVHTHVFTPVHECVALRVGCMSVKMHTCMSRDQCSYVCLSECVALGVAHECEDTMVCVDLCL